MPEAGAASLVTSAYELLFARARAARDEILLVSPFLSAPIARELARAADLSGARRRRLLTSLSGAATAAGVLSPTGLRTLLEAGFELRSARDLHAKVALVDGRWGLVGSGNLTMRGLGQDPRRANAELGVLLSRAQVTAARRIAERWWEIARPLDAATIDRFPEPGPGQPHLVGEDAIGPSLGRALAPGLDSWRAQGHSSGRWLKMMYDTPVRDDAWWERMAIVSDEHRTRPDGRVYYEPSYELGDLLVLYVVGRACPAIFEVTRRAEYAPERVRHDPLAQRDDWLRWGYVTEVRLLHSTAIERAPTLGRIGVGTASVRRHGRIRLTLAQFEAARAAILGG
ncbi:MAG TPA: phospholipase D family protein [Conexibacter sp.]|nr:phospholipase D family protein [Conexibacter sp.]